MRVFILAGGFATRLWPLTEKRAKPLLPLAGKPLIDHMLEQIPDGIHITVSTNSAFQKGFEEWAGSHAHKLISLVIEETRSDDQKLGALGAVAQWIENEKIDDDILLLTGDNYFGFPLKNFIESFENKTPILAAFDIQDAEQAKSFGTVILDTNEQRVNELTSKRKRVAAFEEKPPNPKSTLVSTGCSILPKSTLPILKEYAKQHPDNVGGIFEEFLRRKLPVQCFTFTEPWFDVGSFSAYLEATKSLVGDKVMVGEEAQSENNKNDGSVIIGNRSYVKDSQLSNTVIFSDCTIEDCVLTDCIIDRGCKLKGIDLTGKMLREGTKLEKE